MGASRVSAFPGVRTALLDLQRLAGRSGGVVLEGRDIGTVIFPDAEVKFFLTASPEVRARRRYDELRAKGQDVQYEATLEEVRTRDKQDTLRPIAPLRQADDATVIDSSALTVDEIVNRMSIRVAATRHSS
jgi:cytidylate kinase